MKRILSFVLSLVLVVTAVTCFKSDLFVQNVQAYPGQVVNGVYEELGFREYDATDPNSMLLYDTRHISGWAGSTEWHFPGTGTSREAPGAGTGNNGNFYFNYGDTSATVPSSSFTVPAINVTPGHTPTADQTSMMNAWKTNKMLGIWNPDKNEVSTGGSWHYWYDFQVFFNTSYDLRKFTHVYFEFWLEGNYTKGTPGQLNVAFWTSGVSSVDGFEYDIDFTKLKSDANGKINTGHIMRLDLRAHSDTVSNGGTHKLSSIGGMTIRYMSPTANIGSYANGSPHIYFTKAIAYTEIDNYQPNIVFSNGSGSAYTSYTDQNALVAFAGQSRWNTSTIITIPGWVSIRQPFIIGMDYGATSGSTSYGWNALDRISWRYKRNLDSTNETTDHFFKFPNDPNAGGGGAGSQQFDRKNNKYITSHTKYTKVFT